MSGERSKNKRRSSPRKKKQHEVVDEEDDIGTIEDAGDGEEEEEEEGAIRIGDIYIPPPPPPACTFESSAPRLIITHIDNENFKSYAGRQVLGPFHKNFTSIVGPNGSGKSNVIDSMLFVFGYRAQKIRSKKISVLLHNSDQYPDVNSCTVAVHFQQITDLAGDDFDAVPNSQFVISRTAFKDNSSYYQINGKRVQFRAVAKMLRSHGVDLDHNRFLILQGEVEQIALMKPKAQTDHDTGMLEFLEDIIGSSRFKEPIEKLNKNVEELNEQRAEKLNRVKLVEKEKDELEGPKTEAINFLKLENEIAEKKSVLYQKYILECSGNVAKAEEKKQVIDRGMAELKQQLEKQAGRKKEKEMEMKALANELETVTRRKEELNEKFKGLENADVKLQEDLRHSNMKRKKLLQTLRSEREKLEELEKVPQKNGSDIEECTRMKTRLEKDQKSEEEHLSTVMASLREETQELQDEKEKQETKLIQLKKEQNGAKSAMDLAQSELDIYVSNEQKEKVKLEQMQASYETATRTLKQRKSQVNEVEAKIPQTETALKECHAELEQVTRKEVEISAELRTQRLNVEETRSSMRNSHSRSQVTNALMEQKRNGTLQGIFGRLGDLGAIDAKYDVAISTACGALDNIVVDTVETGQECIKFLKKNNIGVGTFIALDKQQRWRDKAYSRIQTPENVPRLFDLVKIKDEQVKTAFYFALRDTLVADDLDQATRIAYGRMRHRVVTLQGELIEPSGTMSGGGRSVLRGRMGQAVAVLDISLQEFAEMETKLEQLSQQAGDLRHRKAELEALSQKLDKELRQMKLSQKKYNLDLQSLADQEVALKEQLKEQQVCLKEAAPDKNKVKDLQNILSKKSKENDRAAQAAGVVEATVKKLHSQILEITEGKVKGAKKKLNETNKKIDKIAAEITRLNVATKTAARNAKKSEEKVRSVEQEIVEMEHELRQMQEQRKQIEEGAATVLDELQKVTKREIEIGGELEEKKARYDDVVKEETKLRANKIEVGQELEKYEGTIKENQGKISHWKKQLSKLRLQEVGEEEVSELRTLPEAALLEVDTKQLQYELTVLEDRLATQKPNLAAILEYKKKEEVYLQRVAELDAITEQRDCQRRHHEEFRRQRLNEFMAGFATITSKLKEMYQMITLGGDAELELVDSLDPFSEGIVFSVRPPKKSWKNISNLSGGEKTLSSLALVFALHYYKPTPLYIMDEIDAALDFKNVSIVANYIKERTKNAQFVIISLRSNMFELADRLVGIYKTYDTTKSVTINPHKIGQLPETPLPTSQSENNPTRSGPSRVPDSVTITSLPSQGSAAGDAAVSVAAGRQAT